MCIRLHVYITLIYSYYIYGYTHTHTHTQSAVPVAMTHTLPVMSRTARVLANWSRLIHRIHTVSHIYPRYHGICDTLLCILII